MLEFASVVAVVTLLYVPVALISVSENVTGVVPANVDRRRSAALYHCGLTA
jgi:hypothetical protein